PRHGGRMIPGARKNAQGRRCILAGNKDPRGCALDLGAADENDPGAVPAQPISPSISVNIVEVQPVPPAWAVTIHNNRSASGLTRYDPRVVRALDSRQFVLSAEVQRGRGHPYSLPALRASIHRVPRRRHVSWARTAPASRPSSKRSPSPPASI